MKDPKEASRETLDFDGSGDSGLSQKLAQKLSLGGSATPQSGTGTGTVKTSTFGAAVLSDGRAGAEGQSQQQQQQQQQQQEEQPSLMEQMMAEATKGKEEKKKQDRTREMKRTKEFGGGLKKGFFDSSNSSGKEKKKNKNKKSSTSISPAAPTVAAERLEVTGDGKKSLLEQLDSSSGGAGSSNSRSGSVGGSRNSSVVFPEIQESMLAEQLKGGEWCTPDLIAKLQTQPHLVAALGSPQVQQFISLMSSDPNKAKEVMAKNPAMAKIFTEFTGLMGTHFEALGDKQDEERAAKAEQAGREEEERKRMERKRELALQGPLSRKAIEKYEKQQQENEKLEQMKQCPKNKSPAASSHAGIQEIEDSRARKAREERERAQRVETEEKERVDSILQDESLREILMDPAMQQVLQECGDPARLQYYIRQRPDVAAKIHKLAAAGLVQVQK